jgi:hypothetical protein
MAATRQGPDVIAISPSGESAGLYDSDSRIVQTFRGLPHSPEIIGEFDTSRIPGRATALAVSDDGAIALTKFVDEGWSQFWVMDSSGVSWPILGDNLSAAAFLPNSRNAVVTESAMASAFLLVDGRARPLISAHGVEPFSSVSTSEDGRQVFLASVRSGVVAIVDIETGRLTLMSCHCEPTGLHPLKGYSIFRLNDPSREPVKVLDAGQIQPRIVVIPPHDSETLGAQ